MASVDLFMKNTLPGELLAVSRNKLVPGEAGPLGLARSQDVKASENTRLKPGLCPADFLSPGKASCSLAERC